MSQIYAKIISDSISTAGHRITTVECRYPRFVHAELMSHRAFSRNAASSRAIPTRKLVDALRTEPVVPIHFGQNQPGMQAHHELPADVARQIEAEWRALASQAADCAERWAAAGLHKQVVNRVLEPWLTITTIITATDWNNFFVQRCDNNAQPEMNVLAESIRAAIARSTPQLLREYQWHSPYVTKMDTDSHCLEELIKISVARCARVSYLNHSGERNVQDDLKLFDRLKSGKHYSPFEHVAKPTLMAVNSANLFGWISYRHYSGTIGAP